MKRWDLDVFEKVLWGWECNLLIHFHECFKTSQINHCKTVEVLQYFGTALNNLTVYRGTNEVVNFAASLGKRAEGDKYYLK